MRKTKQVAVDYSHANRGIGRSVAKRQMKETGMCRLCKKINACLSPAQMKRKNGYVADGKRRSYFSNNWRYQLG